MSVGPGKNAKLELVGRALKEGGREGGRERMRRYDD